MSSAKPRPRPRPRQAAAATSSSPQPPSSNDVDFSNASASEKLDDDDDIALFIKNRGRTAQDWKRLQQLTNEANSHARVDSSEEEELVTPSPRRKYRKKPNKENLIPRWQRAGVTRLLPSEDDDDVVIVESSPKGKEREQQVQIRERARSRSRSITPPPALPMHQIQHAKDLVRLAFDPLPRAPSPIFVEDDSMETVLDPELAAIAQSIISNKTSHPRQNEPASTGGPEDVMLRVKWQPHPLNNAGKPQLWMFKMRRHDTFHMLFEELADMAAVLSDNLVLTYEGNRVFASATPHGMRIWAEAELDACDQKTYEYIRSNRFQEPTSIEDRHQSLARSPSPPILESGTDTDAENPSGEKFKLVCRSAVAEDITLTVRSTTTCGAIVKAFLKSARLEDKYANASASNAARGRGKKDASVPSLVIDGEKMSAGTPIGNADLEDGDLVEVVGL